MKVDTILIESDTVAKAIADLIPVLNVGKLVVGISKASLRYVHTPPILNKTTNLCIYC